MSIGLDTQRAFGWEGGTINVSAWNIRGRNISTDNLLNLQTASGILAAPTTRLWEVWYQQSFLDGRVDVKIGQQSIDQEFMTSQGSGLFLNTMMGWPMVPSADLYAGGPAYPLSSLGVRLRAQPGSGFTALLGVFAGQPAGRPVQRRRAVARQHALGRQLQPAHRRLGHRRDPVRAEPARQRRHGLRRRAAACRAPTSSASGIDTAPFPDQQFDNTGLSLANPASTGIALMRRNNFSIYGVADQMVWRPSENSPRSVSVFARLMGAPGDRNLINFSVNAGVTLKAPFPGRDDDTVGIGFGIAKVSGGAAAFDRDAPSSPAAVAGPRPARPSSRSPTRSQSRRWWQLQPDFQYVFNPGGGIQNPNNPTQRVAQRGDLRPAQHDNVLTVLNPVRQSESDANESQFHATALPARCRRPSTLALAAF